MNKINYDHPFLQVEKFLVAFDQTVHKDNDKQRVLYAKLISEEFAEFLQAYFEKDNVEQLDAVCDLVWVLVGYAKSRGWDIEGAFDEVARSNMSKLDPATGKPIKREDGKVMKGENYFRPELEKYVGRIK
jgi:predicted HAD superfamily Cof-like phosphohydrolase